MKKNIVLSGIRATGKLHLGNFVGAIKYFVELSQNPNNKCYYFIADLHTLTTHQDPKSLKQSIKEIVLDFLGAGLDPKVATIYRQSDILEIPLLSWILACITPVGRLTGMPHFKEKTEGGASENAGLLTYPVLMAADILAPRANLVPVGQDQRPHVELTRDLARRFNSTYGEVFPLPGLLKGEGVRLPGLTEKAKMGKSESEEAVIYLTDTPEVVKGKIRTAITDPKRKTRKDPGDPSICNIFTFHTLFSSAEDIGRINQGCQNAEIGCVECKNIIAAYVNEILREIQVRRKQFENEGSDFVEKVLQKGKSRAQKRIRETMNQVRELVGIPIP